MAQGLGILEFLGKIPPNPQKLSKEWIAQQPTDCEAKKSGCEAKIGILDWEF